MEDFNQNILNDDVFFEKVIATKYFNVHIMY